MTDTATDGQAETPGPGTAWADGIETVHVATGRTLDAWFPSPALGAPDGPAAAGDPRGDEARGVELRPVRREIELSAAPADTADVWLRLHLLSHRLVRPHGLNLDGIFSLLTNVVWTSAGPCAAEDFETGRGRLRTDGPVRVHGVDKFPAMTDYVVPAGVRIADATRVRLGAHLAPGTTVMHEGFVNYNAGTLGESMIEGRVSAGVVVGAHSDVGGGASIMGTLSGGGTQRITVGERCLIGANAGIGISLGDRCVVEAGCYVTAGSKIAVRTGDGTTVVKAVSLSGVPDLTFWRNSVTGALEAVPRSGGGPALNSALHAND